ncbi:MAG: hypothetical protein K2M48_05550, partial [Clostridiales bacterium]|nr:hypothetical protein [Clostridiales bacterium]
KQNHPNAFLVGENLDGNPENVGPFFEGMDSQFNFHGYYEAGHAFAAAGGGALKSGTMDTDPGYATWSGGAIGSYKKELEGEQYTDAGVFHDVKGYPTYNSHYIDGRYTSNHDLPRARDLMNMQTHGNDELWRSFFNDATQDCSLKPTKSANATMVSTTDALLRLYYAFNMTLPGVSWIYYGDELGMTGNMNTRLTGEKEDSHEDRIYRQPMKWYDEVEKNAAFSINYETYKCELVGLNATDNVKGVDGQDKDAGSLLNWMRTLTKVRNDHPELINGAISIQGSSNGLQEYTLSGSTGKTKVYISTNGSVANRATAANTYATWTSGSYSVMICKG